MSSAASRARRAHARTPSVAFTKPCTHWHSGDGLRAHAAHAPHHLVAKAHAPPLANSFTTPADDDEDDDEDDEDDDDDDDSRLARLTKSQ